MSAGRHVATRHSPPPVRKKSALKSARSVPASTHRALTPRGTVRGAVTSTTTSSTTSTPSSSSKSKHPRDGEDDDYFQRFDSDGDDDMATTFLQYCAMCEKQIIVPNSSILYCSESCRRRDASTPPSCDTGSIIFSLTSPNSRIKPRSNYPPTMEEHLNLYHLTGGPGSLPSTSKPSYSYDSHPHTGIKQARIPPMFHDGKPDLDPTEWKPADKGSASGEGGNHSPPSSSSSSVSLAATTDSLTAGSGSGSWKPKFPHRPSSDASMYLSQFHRASSDSLASATAANNKSNRGRRARHADTAHIPPALISPTARTSNRSTDADASGGRPYATKSRASGTSLPTTALTVVTSGSGSGSGSGSSGTIATTTSDSPSTSPASSPLSSSTSVEDPGTGSNPGTAVGGGAGAGRYSYGLHIFDRATAFEKSDKKKEKPKTDSKAHPTHGSTHLPAEAAVPFAPAARGSLKKLLSG